MVKIYNKNTSLTEAYIQKQPYQTSKMELFAKKALIYALNVLKFNKRDTRAIPVPITEKSVNTIALHITAYQFLGFYMLRREEVV